MNKHTKGPWLVTGEDNDFIYALGPNGCNKFWFSVCSAGPDKINSEEKAANARLIAAAPDLLEALQLLVQGEAKSYITIQEINKAIAAITKATGESK